MCCTFGRSTMSKTRIYVGEAERNGETVHVLAYQNVAKSLGANAMVLPFPTDVAMSQENVIDTRQFKHFLKDITNASKEMTKGLDADSFSRGDRRLASAKVAQVFSVGSYTVVLADNVEQIPEALERVPADRRPAVSRSFLNGYAELYPKDPIAVCCWNGAIEAEPLMWWYVPRDRSELFIPTMDAHDGLAPAPGVEVQTDHIISVGSVGPTNGYEVRYSQDTIPEAVRDLLPSYVHGHKLPHYLENGDCFVKTSDLHQDSKVAYFRGGSRSVILERGDYAHRMDGWS
jgi:hypothetical protein